MTESIAPHNDSAPAAVPNVTQRVLGQYIRDLSFENMIAQKGLAGDAQQQVSVHVDLNFRRRGGDNQYEVITKLPVANKLKSSGDALFLLEVEYAGLFEIHESSGGT